jgi:APA family basic amino acid/polyamine antiporter
MDVPNDNSRPQLRRELRLRDGVAIVAGTIIGSGIFLVPSSVVGQLGSLAAVLSLWIVGGVLTLFGALSLGELGAAFPGAGGIYIYLEKAYGRAVGFLYGWAALVAMESGSVATLAAAFGIYLAQFLPLSGAERKLASVGCVLVLTAVNCAGVKTGKLVQNLFTATKIGGLAAMIVVLLTHAQPHLLSENFWPGRAPFAPSAFATAMIAVLWAYQGWHSVCYVASEFRDPERDLPRSLLAGTLVVAAVYVLANLAYYAVLSPAEIAGADRVAAVALTRVKGPAAGSMVSLLIMISIFGATNGTALTAARAYYAMAGDGLFFKAVARVHPRFHTPAVALVLQGAWASVLVLAGTFQQLFTYVIFTGWIFYAIAVAGVLVLRRKQPELPRPYRVPGYPWVPLLFVIAAAGLTLNTIAADFVHAVIGIGVVLVGLPVYLLFRQKALHHEAKASSR